MRSVQDFRIGVGRNSLKKFDVKVLICLKHICGSLVGKPHVTVGRNRFVGEENINPLCFSCGGPSVKKPWRGRQEAQLYYFRGWSVPNADVGSCWLRAESLVKGGGNIVCVYCMLLRLNPGVRGAHPTGQLPGTDTLSSITRV